MKKETAAKPVKRLEKPSIIELFAGVGGFALAAKAGGFRTLLWNQWEPSTKTKQHAQSVYMRRFGDFESTGFSSKYSTTDISIISDELAKDGQFKNATALVGGFPCQDYSVAKSSHKALGLEGKKGVLWWEILKLAAGLTPTYLVLENVDRLLKSPANARGRDFAIMLSSLAKIGYAVEWRVITSSDYGSAQRRKRIFIVAQREKSSLIGKVKTAPDASKYLTASGILARAYPALKIENVVEIVNVGTDPTETSASYIQSTQASPFQNAGIMYKGRVFTANLKAQISAQRTLDHILLDRVNPNIEIPEEYFVNENQIELWQNLKSGGKRPRTSKTGFTYNYSEGSMSFPDRTDRPARTILTGEGGTSPSRFKHAVATPDGRIRRLLPEELEALNDFPPGWTAEGLDGKIPDTRRAFLMGNALVVDVVSRIFKIIAQDIKKNASR